MLVTRRLISVDILNEVGLYEPIDLDANYSVATLDYIVKGGDGYVTFHKPTVLVCFLSFDITKMKKNESGVAILDIVANFINKTSPLSYVVEDRIVRSELPANDFVSMYNANINVQQALH